jgi:DnaJ-class molecular chaperone
MVYVKNWHAVKATGMAVKADYSNDFYRTLDVQPNATLAEIRNAFRIRAMECHPDKGGSEAPMIDVAEAWEVLSDPELRKEYYNLNGAHALRLFGQGAMRARAIGVTLQVFESRPRRVPSPSSSASLNEPTTL